MAVAAAVVVLAAAKARMPAWSSSSCSRFASVRLRFRSAACFACLARAARRSEACILRARACDATSMRCRSAASSLRRSAMRPVPLSSRSRVARRAFASGLSKVGTPVFDATVGTPTPPLSSRRICSHAAVASVSVSDPHRAARPSGCPSIGKAGSRPIRVAMSAMLGTCRSSSRSAATAALCAASDCACLA